MAATRGRLAWGSHGYHARVRRFWERLQQLFNRGRDRDPLLSDETPEQHFAEMPAGEKERELDDSLLPPAER